MIKFICVAVIVMSLSSCAFFKSTSRVALETAYLESIARTGETQQILKTSNELTDFQMMQLTHAFNTLANFRGKWKAFLNDPTKNIATIDPNELNIDFLNIKAQYMVVYDVAIQNWDQYGAKEKLHLTNIHRHASKLSGAVDGMMAEAKYIDALKTGLDYVVMAGSLAIAFKP
jgi:hypothetical protein